MALREFDDTEGRSWRVWHTLPVRVGGVIDDSQGGWLTFDNGAERWRLSPVPDGWETLTPDELVLLLEHAHRAVRREPGDNPGAERRVGERRTADRRQGDRRNSPPP